MDAFPIDSSDDENDAAVEAERNGQLSPEDEPPVKADVEGAITVAVAAVIPPPGPPTAASALPPLPRPRLTRVVSLTPAPPTATRPVVVAGSGPNGAPPPVIKLGVVPLALKPVARKKNDVGDAAAASASAVVPTTAPLAVSSGSGVGEAGAAGGGGPSSRVLQCETASRVEEEARLANLARSIKRKQQRDPRTVFVEATKRVPKYVGPTKEREIFTPRVVKERIVDSILNDDRADDDDGGSASGSASSPPSSEHPLSRVCLLDVKVSDAPAETWSVVLTARGRSDLVDRVRGKVNSIVVECMATYNLRALLRDGSSLELDIVLDCVAAEADDGSEDEEGRGAPSSMMGARFVDVASSSSSASSRGKKAPPGVWFFARPGGQLRDIIGKASDGGLAVLRIDDKPVSSAAEAEEAWDVALADCSRKTAVVTICVGKDADLGGVDRSRVVRASNCPRRRDGGAYRGRFPGGTAVREEVGGRGTAAAATKKKKRKLLDADAEGAPKRARSQQTGTGVGGAIDPQANYNRFRLKYKPVHEIEYKNYGIIEQFTDKSAWARHKRIYGDRCDDDCPCPSDLPRITAAVVTDFLKRQAEKEGDAWNNPYDLKPGESPVGFVTYFAPKFYGKVLAEMPGANPAQVLEKLESMWSKHKEERRFGLTCGRRCPCGEGWERIFKAKVLRAKPSRFSRVGSARPATAAVAPAPVHSGASAQTAAAGPARPSIAKSTTSAATGGSLLRQMLPQQQKEFTVLFNKSVPLGMYCITERKQLSMGGSRSICKVASVCPYTGKRDARVKNGTIILGSAPFSLQSPKEDMVPLHSHLELKSRYEAVKTKKGVTKLRLWFTHPDVSPSVVGTAAAKRDWMTSGAWVGSSKVDGWAGGAPVVKKKSSSTEGQSTISGLKRSQADMSEKQQSQRLGRVHVASRSTNQGTLPGPADARKPSDAAAKEQDDDGAAKRASLAKRILAQNAHVLSEQKEESSSIMSHASKRTGSLLLDPKRQRNRVRKNVSFSKQLHETKLFAKDTDAAVGTVVDDKAGHAMATSDDEGAPNQSAKKAAGLDMDIPIHQRRSKRLFDAVRGKDYRAVIKALVEGAPPDLADANGQKPMDCVKQKISELERILVDGHAEDRAEIQASLQDLQWKKTVLKIYLQVEHAIKLARYLKDWVNVQVEPQRVNDLILTETGKFHPASDFIFCVVILEKRPQEPTMPLIPFSHSPDWTSVDNCPKYHLSFNKEMEFSYSKGREVKVDIIKGSSKSSGRNLKLGTWTETVENIKDVLDLSIAREITRDIPRNEVLEKGSMTVNFKVVQFSANFYRRKRADVSEALSTAMDWIESFQSETGVDKTIFDPNVSLPTVGDLSILHAAVYVADTKLVNRLLALGANPSANSLVGSAENLALNLADESETITAITEGTHEKMVEIMHALKRNIEARALNEQMFEGNVQQGLQQNATEQAAYAETIRIEIVEHGVGQKASLGNTGHQTGAGYQQQGVYGQAGASAHGIQNEQPMCGQTQSFGQAPTNDQQLLPTISPVDWIKGKYKRCNLYNRPGGCDFGASCKKAHVHAPMGLILENSQWSPDHAVMLCSGGDFKASCIHVKASPDASGKKWYTAAYLDPTENVIYYAERGSRSAQSKQGIYWYPEEGDAILAAKRVVLVAKQARSDLNSIHAASTGLSLPPPVQAPLPPPPVQGPPPPPPPPHPQLTYQHLYGTTVQPPLPPMTAPPPPPPPPPILLPTPPPPPGGSAGDVDMHARIFQSLISGDLQAIYVKIFPGNSLRRTVWRPDRKAMAGGALDMHTTEFHSPAREDNGAIYFPYGHGGIYDGARWWYHDEKSAKASTFLQFLVHMVQKGLVKADLTGTIGGKKFFSKR